MRVHVDVHGRVQGVFFRDECRQEATRHHLAGWVRNTRDDTVEAEFEGTEESVEAMVAWCRQGPPRAQVAAVDVRVVDDTGESGFEVR